MGFIRGGLFTILSIIFLIAILSIALLMTVSKSLEYKNLEDNVGEVIVNEIGDQINLSETLNETQAVFNMYCQNQTEVVLESEDLPIDLNISCESLQQGEDAVINEVVNESIEQIYYDEYDCNVWDCLDNQEQVFFFFSEGFKNYVEAKSTLFLIIIIIVFILMLLLAEHRSNAFIVAGILMIIVALPFMKLSGIFGFVEGALGILFDVFFSKSYSTFIKLFIWGLAFLIIGLAFKFTSLGTKFAELLDKIKLKQGQENKKEESKPKKISKPSKKK